MKHFMKTALGWLGWTPEVFDRATYSEYAYAMEGYCERLREDRYWSAYLLHVLTYKHGQIEGVTPDEILHPGKPQYKDEEAYEVERLTMRQKLILMGRSNG